MVQIFGMVAAARPDDILTMGVRHRGRLTGYPRKKNAKRAEVQDLPSYENICALAKVDDPTVPDYSNDSKHAFV